MFQQQRRIDELNRTMLIAALVLSLAGMIVSNTVGWLRIVLSLLSGALLVLIVIRMTSRNFNKRNQENMKRIMEDHFTLEHEHHHQREQQADGGDAVELMYEPALEVFCTAAAYHQHPR